jgi:hypothetical protein
MTIHPLFRRYKLAHSTLFLLLSMFSLDTFAAVSASVDKNPVMLDESVNLSIIADKDVDRSAFDPSPLLKDFVVGRTSVSSQTQMINFNTTRTTMWTTTLIPRNKGIVTIPAFTIAGERTQAIALEVIPASASTSADNRDVYISTEVDSAEAYLQQQLHYTVKLHLAVDLQRGSLSNPTLDNADIRQIGKDKEYNEISNGRRYRIIERNFAITPQQSGKFTIQGPLFEGEVVENNRQSFGFFNRSKPVNRVGPAVEVNVLPMPQGYAHHWLPSEFVELNEEWQPGNGEYKVGEPITRTLTLTAVGLVEEQLPEINSQYPPQVKIYPDQANTNTIEKDNTLIAQRVETIAIIPNKEGDLVIPDVKIPWFNVLTKQTEYATLPARLIKIAPSALADQKTLPVTPKEVVVPPISAKPTLTTTELNPSTVLPQWYWWSLSSWVLLVLWLSTLLLWAITASRKKAAKQTSHQNESEQAYWQQLQKALATNNIQQIYLPLCQWLGQLHGNPQAALPTSQNKLKDKALNQELALMYAKQYGRDKANWKAEQLLLELKRIRAVQNNASIPGRELRDLYPNHLKMQDSAGM